MDPANVRLIAHFGIALANLAVAEETDPDVSRRVLAKADYQTRRALQLDPNDNEVRKLRDEVVKVQNSESKKHRQKTFKDCPT